MVYGIDAGSGMPDTEAAAGHEVANFIGNITGNNGYDATNLCGDDTTNTNVYSYVQSSESNFARVATFHFGHFYEAYESFQDNDDNPVSASTIGQYTTGKEFFVFLWACYQAQDATSPMPTNWTQRYSGHGGFMNSNGFFDPDSGANCFITFDGISSEIGNSSGTFEYSEAFPTANAGPLKNFIEDFYTYALNDNYQYSIHDSLNMASNDFFSRNYQNCVLNGGENGTWYHAWYPGGQGFEAGYWGGHMMVFGNSNIKLYQPEITLNANHGSPTFYIDGNALSPGDVHVIPDQYAINAGDDNIPQGYTFSYLVYQGHASPQWYRPANMNLQFDGTVLAYYAYTAATAPSQPELSGPSPPMHRTGEYEFDALTMDPNDYNAVRFNFTWGDGTYTLTDWYDGYWVGNSYQFTGSATHAWNSLGEFNVTVTAEDSTELYSSPSDPLTVNILQESYQIYVSAYDYYDSYELNEPVWIDSTYVGHTPIYSYPAAIGWHTVEVASGNFAYFDGYDWYTNPVDVYVSENTYLTAYYIFQK